MKKAFVQVLFCPFQRKWKKVWYISNNYGVYTGKRKKKRKIFGCLAENLYFCRKIRSCIPDFTGEHGVVFLILQEITE